MDDDLEIDPVAERVRRGTRHRSFNTAELPAMRALGFALIAGASALHNGLIDLELSAPPRMSAGTFAAIAAGDCLLSWLALRRWYREDARFLLGQAFLFVDVGMMALAVYVTGGTASLLFPIFMVRVASKFMEKLGCRVDVVANGLEAVEAAERLRYDLILMDIQMPEMDGFAATSAIRQRQGSGSRVPIVALTANAMAGDRERCLAGGMDDYLPKPITAADITTICRRWLPAPRSRTAGMPVLH